jgi:hypothetical protein
MSNILIIMVLIHIGQSILRIVNSIMNLLSIVGTNSDLFKAWDTVRNNWRARICVMMAIKLVFVTIVVQTETDIVARRTKNCSWEAHRTRVSNHFRWLATLIRNELEPERDLTEFDSNPEYEKCRIIINKCHISLSITAILFISRPSVTCTLFPAPHWKDKKWSSTTLRFVNVNSFLPKVTKQ